ncbi:energy-coupling factor transporter transmembrane component T family protein [Sutcliffiella halmapala]|uniref:energy-coupling factor transporter transmembrane component T family protein n=1 Tax=Sutcliffiella halmapala TaxID=79882 RepID=UPI0009957C4E|nr:energy-coupling factor transporter transmembrane component T [Sutcliffiella halmapala]
MQLALSKNSTWMHDVNPSFKLLGMILIFISIILIHNINVMINVTFLFFIMYFFLTGHTFKLKSILLIPFLLLFFSSAISMVLFGKGDTTWFRAGIIHITEESFYRGVHLGLRSMAFAFCGLIFALTTKPVFLFYSLMQQCKLPPKYAYGFMAGVRLLPIMFEEFFTLKKALIVRGVEQKKGVKAFLKKIHYYSIPLLSQSIRRAHRIAVAMEAKRFMQQKQRTYFYEIRFSKKDLWFFLVFLSLYAVAFYGASSIPYLPITDVRYK